MHCIQGAISFYPGEKNNCLVRDQLPPPPFFSTLPGGGILSNHYPWSQQQQQLKKLGIIIHYLDKFNHNWSLHTPRAPGQTASQSEPLERASLLPGLSPGYVWHIAIQLLFAWKQRPLYVVVSTLFVCIRSASNLPASRAALIANSQ